VTVTIQTPVEVEAAVRLPHPETAREETGEPLPDAERERVGEENRKRVERFLAAEGIRDLPREWRDDASFVCECLESFKVDYVDGVAGGLAARHVEWFLLDYVPRKVDADDRTIERTPEILDRYCVWLASAGLEPEERMRRVRARITRLREEFMAAARDPENFGPAKSLVRAMGQAGVDVSDEAAVRAYVDEHNRALSPATERRKGSRRGRRPTPASGRAKLGSRTAGETGLRPTGARSSKAGLAGGTSRAPRWTPAAGEAAPAADAPCPCGSGRRYGRCCMPR
jgi:hypothetical protein